MNDLEKNLELLTKSDCAAVIASICAGPDARVIAKAFYDLMRDLYWKHKDLANCIAISRAAIAYCLVRAGDVDKSDPKLAFDLRSTAKGLCYDIASFTWNGWDEPGIPITSADLAAGFDAAKANLRLAHELNKGDLPLARAHWMLAGHYLSRCDRKAAADHYQQSERRAAATGSKPDELLAKGFAHLVDVLEKPNDTEAKQRLDAIKTQLKEVTDGQMFIDQITTAHRVFSAKDA